MTEVRRVSSDGLDWTKVRLPVSDGGRGTAALE